MQLTFVDIGIELSGTWSPNITIIGCSNSNYLKKGLIKNKTEALDHSNNLTLRRTMLESYCASTGLSSWANRNPDTNPTSELSIEL